MDMLGEIVQPKEGSKKHPKKHIPIHNNLHSLPHKKINSSQQQIRAMLRTVPSSDR